MKKQRIFEINNKNADYFTAYCRSNRIDTVIERRNDYYKKFYCLMNDKEFQEAKAFCDLVCKAERKVEKAEEPDRIFVFIIIIIEETR